MTSERKSLLPDVLYFGCWNDAGHSLHGEGGTRIRYDLSPVPKLDGSYVPGRGASGPEGVVRVTKLNGWTILGFRDNSIDSRPASHSTFLVRGDLDYDEALGLARSTFPFVFQRIEARGITLTPEAVRA